MTTCPRCGFEQPIDRFCAKCGILMEGYVKKPTPFWSKVRGSLPFYGLILVLVLGGSYLAYEYLQKENLSGNRLKTLSPSPALATPAQAPQPTISETTVQATQKQLPPSARQFAPVKEGGDPSFAAAGAQASLAPTVAAQPTVTAANLDPTKVRVEFALMNREGLRKLSQDAEGRLEIGTYSLAIIPHFHTNYDQAVKVSGGFQSLSGETRALTTGQASMIFQGSKEPKTNETIGFYVEVTPLRRSDRGGFEYKISIKRSLPDVSASGEIKVNSQNFEESVMLPSGNALAIVGLLPRKVLVPGEELLYTSNVLKPLVEPGFKNGDEEFILLLHPSHPGEEAD